eukprot:6492130-Amphidinium_carterae.4
MQASEVYVYHGSVVAIVSLAGAMTGKVAQHKPAGKLKRWNVYHQKEEEIIGVLGARLRERGRANIISYPDWQERGKGKKEPKMQRARLENPSAFLKSVISLGRVHRRGLQRSLETAFHRSGDVDWLDGVSVSVWSSCMSGRIALAVRHSWNLVHRCSSSDVVDPLISRLFPAEMIQD